MSISSYTDFHDAANSQPQPQRLLFVFAEAELPPQHTDSQKQRFQERQGGVLTPVMCVDKLPDEAKSFAGLVEESQRTGQHWDIVFVAAMDGRAGVAPASEAAEQPMKKMIEAIQQGAINRFLAFDRDGELVRFA